ncbi:MAG: sulfite exporter TauE/SafE family protein [Acidimicrobiia bacterium]|nr:sulfite exporter TauE/SafE family protein [Acidimicrobiia bacterium]
MDVLLVALTLTAVAVSFAVSASAGLGGSLILVPTLALMLGTKEGVALAALLLAGNNVVKVIAYRRSLPVRASALIVGCVALGALIGARLLVAAPERLVALAVVMAFAVSLIIETWASDPIRLAGGPTLAFASGATSGFSGTSGPLKGVAVRSLNFDREHTVGAASLASLAGDSTKAAVFADAQLLDSTSVMFAIAAIPLMVVATFTGRHLNRSIGEAGYAALFWTVMSGYTVRILVRL